MCIKLGKIKIHIGFFAAAAAAFAFSCDMGEKYALVSVSVLLHELAHLLFMAGYGVTGANVVFGVGGVAIKAQGYQSLSFKQELVCLLSAPMVNIAVGLLLLPFTAHSTGLFSAAVINLSLGAVNILPLSFLDGGAALEKLLFLKGVTDGGKIFAACDFICLALIFLLFLVFLFNKRNAAGIFFFAVYCLVNVSAKNSRSKA